MSFKSAKWRPLCIGLSMLNGASNPAKRGKLWALPLRINMDHQSDINSRIVNISISISDLSIYQELSER